MMTVEFACPISLGREKIVAVDPPRILRFGHLVIARVDFTMRCCTSRPPAALPMARFDLTQSVPWQCNKISEVSQSRYSTRGRHDDEHTESISVTIW